MEVVTNNYMPGDSRLIQQLVYELKSQGIFDQFRKECISDVDTKPAYQNLRQRVEGSVTSFLKQQTWRPDMNKNQVREQLRKSIYECGYLETGVERIVDQVVNPKINTVFLPQVEDVVYRYLGIEKPSRSEVKKEIKIDVTDLLPTDLEAVSPESDHTDRREDSFNLVDSLNVEMKIEDESPAFEVLQVQQNFVQHEENSVDSHLSGFSGLQSHDSNPCTETKLAELSNQDSQVSHNSSESYLSIITSEENTKMEICEDPESKVVECCESEPKIELPTETLLISEKHSLQKDTEDIKKNEKAEPDKKDDEQPDEKKSEDKKTSEKRTDDKKSDKKGNEERKHERKSDDKKSKSSDKRSSSKDKRDIKKDDKHRKSSSNRTSSSSRDKEKSSSKHSSSSSGKDKDKKDVKNTSSGAKERDKGDKRKSERDKTKDKKDAKSKSNSDKDKDKGGKDKVEKEKSDKEKDKSEKDRDKSKSSSSSSSKHSSSSSSKEKEKSIKKESSSKDKEKSRSSTSKDSNNHSESKSKSSSDVHKKSDKTSHNAKHFSSSSSSKKDKDRKRDSKKELKDDHYSAKDKKTHRRSTDRDSNDGQSGKQSHSTSFSGSSSSSSQKNIQESSNSNSGSGSGDSGNSDQIDHSAVVKSPIKLSENVENNEVIIPCVDVQKLKYIKPKFASNFQEARKLMKIRKQLAKLERQNQLSLARIDVPTELPVVNGLSYDEADSSDEVEVKDPKKEVRTPERKEILPKNGPPVLQSTDLSKESWEALEARLAQEMSNVNYNSYESPYDDYDCAATVISPRKNTKAADERYTLTEEKVGNVVECLKLNMFNDERVKSVPDEEVNDVIMETTKEEAAVETDIKNRITGENKLKTDQQEDTLCNNPEGAVQNILHTLHEGENCLNKNVLAMAEETNKPILVVNMEKLVVYKEKQVSEEERVMPARHHTKMNVEVIHRNEAKIEIEQCKYLERPSPSLERRLQFIYRYVGRLERDIKRTVKPPQNNCLALKRGRKRKLNENVDVKNNNKAHYEQTAEMKKRRRSIAPNPNAVISKAIKNKMCNNTDISPNDRFSLPLSPAESDKSNDKKEEESPKSAKQKRNVIVKNTTSRNQRYSSDDLYKPRPMIASSRRSRSAKNPGN